jgi:hypothetical protein
MVGRRFLVTAVCATACSAWLVSFGYSSLPATASSRRPPSALESVGGPVGQDIPSLRERVGSLNAHLQSLSGEIATLTKQRDLASEVVESLPDELKELRATLPRLTAALTAATAEAQAAKKTLTQYSGRFKEFRELAPEVDEVDRAERLRRGDRLSTLEEAAWRENPWAKKTALLYISKRDSFASNEQMLGSELTEAKEKQTALAATLATAQEKLAQGPRQLVTNKEAIERNGKRLNECVQLESRMTAERDRLQKQLAAAESKLAAELAAAQRAAEVQRQREAERKRVAQSQVAVAAAPTYATPANRHGRPLAIVLPDDDDPPYSRPTQSFRTVEPPRSGIGMHRDGRGMTHVLGNQTLVQRDNGFATLYTRNGPWEAVETNTGAWGMRYYDDQRGVTQFDYVNTGAGVETIGEQPYPGNDYGQGWSQQIPLW